MILFILRRIGLMALTMLVVSLLVFLLLEINPGSVATKVLGPYSSEEQRKSGWRRNGYNEPLGERYLTWLGNFLTGDFGQSIRFKVPVADVLWPRLANTGILGAGPSWCPAVAGARRASPACARARRSTAASRCSSHRHDLGARVRQRRVPGAVFVFWLDCCPAPAAWPTASTRQLVLPVLVLVIYDFGYVTRMTRASMAEVMTTHYIRTAVLKGLPYKPGDPQARAAQRADRALHRHHAADQLAAVGRHRRRVLLRLQGLRGAAAGGLAEPGHLPDRGLRHGRGLRRGDTQTISDIGYTYLNPRIRFS
jgi:peptide/nickel transport system permease protein